MPGGPRSHLDQLKTAAQARSYLYCWSRSHIIQDVCTDIDHLQQVGEELLHHGHQGPVTQSRPHLFLLGGCGAGLFFGGPRTPQRSGGTGCDTGTHVTPQLHSMGPRRKSFRPVYVESLLDTSTWGPTDASGSTGNRHLPPNLCPQPP